jgi:hypothetical protein
MPQDSEAFAEHFRPDRRVVTFGNLGGDAILVAPCPGGDGSNYSHLASFVATAPASQQDALWQAVGQALEKAARREPCLGQHCGARRRLAAHPAGRPSEVLQARTLRARLDPA